MTPNSMSPEERERLCRSLGFATPLEAHQFIARTPGQNVERLLRRRLDAQTLTRLGYDAAGMRRLGYDETALESLGYGMKKSTSAAIPQFNSADHASDTVVDAVDEPHLRSLLQAGARSIELHRAGFTIHHCKRAGLTAFEMLKLGFPIEELVTVCGAAELRRAGLKPGELRKWFGEHELRSAGFSATEMRMAGYSVRDLLNTGYNENHIRTAGYSNSDLVREGLGRTTRTKEWNT